MKSEGRRFFRLVSPFTGIAASAFLAIACSGQNDGGQTETVIRFWHFWSEPSQKLVLEDIVREFESKTGTRVELTELSWNDGKAKLQAAFNSGAPPDVVELGSDWVAQFSSAGVLMPLPLDSAFTQGFVRFSQPPAMWKGRVYAYPWTVDTRVLWINSDLVAASGWNRPITTLDDLREASERVHSGGAFGFGANGADVHRLYKKILPFMWTLGGDVFDASGQPNLNSEANIKALTLYSDLARTGFIETQRQLDAAFLRGKVAFWISGSWLIQRIRTMATFRAEAHTLPGINARPGISFAGGEYLAVSLVTRNRQRSRELVRFLTMPEQAVKLCSAIPEAGFPSARAAFQHESLISDTLKAVFAKQLEYARMTPVHARWLDLESIIENATVRVLLGEETPQESLEKAQAEALAVIN